MSNVPRAKKEEAGSTQEYSSYHYLRDSLRAQREALFDYEGASPLNFK
jgi:hypothetical protein